VWFAFGSAFSAQAAFPTAAIATFNVLWTSLPTIAHAVMDQGVTVKSALRDVPALYRETSRRSAVSGSDFARRACGWTLSALFASVWCHVSAQMSLGEPGSVEPKNGRVAVNHMAVGLATFTAVIFACDLKIATRTNHWTIVNVVALVVSATLWFPFLVAVSEAWSLIGVFPDTSNAHLALFASPRFWLATTLGAGTAAAADLAFANLRRALRPSLAEVVRERESIERGAPNAITQRVAKALVASASTTMRAVASFAAPSRLRGGGGGGGGLPVSARRAGGGGSWKSACARRKSRNPSVLEVVKQHRNYSDDWNA